MKKIGFIDYYISEWHANNYPGWIEEINEKIGGDYKVAYAWAELDKSPVDGKTTEEWCNEFGVEKCDSIRDLCVKSDYVFILAPSDPETHLRFAREALKSGKRIYIDKTFAPDYKTAKEIFDIAAKYGSEIFSTSALRYATELREYAGKCDTATVFGSGDTIEEYGIHQIEMTVKLMGMGADSIRLEQSADQYNIRVLYGDGRAANIIFCENYGLPAGFIPHTENAVSNFIPIKSEFFKNLIEKILDFFKTGEAPFDSGETLEVMKIREAIIKAKERNGQWVKI